MIEQLSLRPVILLLLTLVLGTSLRAQPILPDMIGATQDGMNILSWTCQYDGIKSIAVQRSADSVFNFATIGYVKELRKGPQAFIDGHPMPGNNWYRLYIVFGSGLTWYSNYLKLVVDSAQLLQQKVLPPNDALQQYASKVELIGDEFSSTAGNKSANNTVSSATAKTETSKNKAPILKIPDINTPEHPAMYIKSQYVFTNPFTGHVNVEIPEASKHHYSISFFTQDDKPILEVPRIREPSVIIDKRNFQRKGIYKFELMKNQDKIETGFITIY